MPTIFFEDGFRFFFYSNENDEPMHIHVKRGDGEGKVWLKPGIKIAYMNNFSSKEERQILKIVANKLVVLQKCWNDYFA